MVYLEQTQVKVLSSVNINDLEKQLNKLIVTKNILVKDIKIKTKKEMYIWVVIYRNWVDIKDYNLELEQTKLIGNKQ